MNGTVAITDHGWYEFLLAQGILDEVNFWTPSAHWGFRGEVGAPFFFKLKARYDHAICGFAHFARYSRLWARRSESDPFAARKVIHLRA
jgi:putative restriction endonuclease